MEEWIKDEKLTYQYSFQQDEVDARARKLVVYAGEFIDYAPGIDVEYMLENIACNAGSECGEVADDYLGNVSKEALRELEEAMNTVFNAWLTKHELSPTFGQIVNEVKYHCNEAGEWVPVTS